MGNSRTSTAAGKAAAIKAISYYNKYGTPKKNEEAARASVEKHKNEENGGKRAATEVITRARNTEITRKAAEALESATHKSARQEMLERALDGQKKGYYTVTRDVNGVSHITQTGEQKAKQLSDIMGELSEKQKEVLVQAANANSERVARTSKGFFEDSDVYKYIKAIQEATDADGNVNLTINDSGYQFNPYSGGQVDKQALRAYNKLSTADKLALNIKKSGVPATPSFGDPDDTTLGAYERYIAALNEVKEADKISASRSKTAETWKKQEAEQDSKEKRKAAVRDSVTNLYIKNRDNTNWNSDAALESQFGDDTSYAKKYLSSLKSRYDLDDDAFVSLTRYRDIDSDDTAALAKARGVSDEGLAQTERGVYTPSAEGVAANVKRVNEKVQEEKDRRRAERDRMASRHDPSRNTTAVDNADRYNRIINYELNEGIDNAEPWTYESGRAYEEYYKALDAGDTEKAKAVVDDLSAKKDAQMTQVGKNARYMTNQAVQGVGDVVHGTTQLAADVLVTASKLNPLSLMSIQLSDAINGNPITTVEDYASWTKQDFRKRSAVINTLYQIADETGTGALNPYDQAGREDVDDDISWWGGIARSGVSGLTSLLGADASGLNSASLNKTFSLASKAGANSPKALQVLAKIVPDITVGAQSIPFLATAYGRGVSEAEAEGYDESTAMVWGAYSAFAEGLPDAISFNSSAALGSTLKSQAYGAVSESAAKEGAKAGIKALADEYGTQGMMNILVTVGKTANSSGMEEIMTNYLEAAGRNLILGEDLDLPTLKENISSYAAGATLSLITQGLSYAASTPAHKKAKTIADDAANGVPPTAEEIQGLLDANNAEAVKSPLTNDDLARVESQGAAIDPVVKNNYTEANNALDKANSRVTNALRQLAAMNQQGVSPSDPARKQVVKDVVEGRQDVSAAKEQRDAAHAKFVKSLDAKSESAELTVKNAMESQSQSDVEFADWQLNELIKTDPQSVVTAADELTPAIQQQLDGLRATLVNGGSAMDATTRNNLMQTVKQLEEGVVKISEARAQAAQVLADAAALTTDQNTGLETSPDQQNGLSGADSVNAGMSDGTAIQTLTGATGTPTGASAAAVEQQAETVGADGGNLPSVADFIDDYRSAGATDAQIIQAVENALNAEIEEGTATTAEIAFMNEVLDELGAERDSIAKRYIAANGSAAKEGRVTDLLNIARQEFMDGNTDAADRAGLNAAREIIANTVSEDSYLDEVKSVIRTLAIAPSEQERANIAAVYGSYDAYRRAVMNTVLLRGAGNGQPIDQAIGELEVIFPGISDNGDRVEWLYDFATKSRKGLDAYADGDPETDIQSLWNKIKSENPHYFRSHSESSAPYAVPDFSAKETRVNKAVAAQWVKDAQAAGVSADEIQNYSRVHRIVALTGKERHFWDNVYKANQGDQPNQTHDFRETRDERVAHETIHLFDETSTYADGNGMRMSVGESTYKTIRSLSSIKRDIQNLIGFTFSDTHYSGAARRRGAVAYYEPAHDFVSTSDTNNITAFLHEAGHAVDFERIGDADEIASFQQTIPQTFINQYPAEVRASEAGAELFRAWMLDPDKVTNLYPETIKAFQDAIGKRKYNRMLDQSNALRKFLNESADNRVGATLYSTETKERQPVRTKLQKFIKDIFDAQYGYKKIDRAMNAAGVELASGGADARNRQVRTSSEAISALFFDGMFDPGTGRKVAPALSEVTSGIRSEESMDAFNVYLELKQAIDRYEANPDDWVFSRDVCTPAEARAYIQKVETTMPDVVESANNLWAWLNAYRDTQLSDAISKDTLDAWAKANPHYIPQTRHFTSDIRAAAGGGGISGQRSGVSSRKVGSTRDIVSPIDAIANMVARTKTAALQHDVLSAVVEYYDSDVDGVAGTFLHEIDPQLVPHTIPADVIRRQSTKALEDAGMDEAAVKATDKVLHDNLEDGLLFEVRTPEGGNGKAFAFTKDGKTRYFEVYDQDLLDAMLPLKKSQVGGILGAVRKISGKVTGLITAQNPSFALSNAVRDMQEAYFTGSEHDPVKFMEGYAKAVVDVFGGSEVYSQFKAMGGAGGQSSVYATPKDVGDLKRKMFGAVADDRNFAQRTMDAVSDAIENFNGNIEAIPRLAEYKRQLERGASYAEAIKAAKDCTTDFSGSGRATSADKALWRFYGSSVNGTYKVINQVLDAKADPKKQKSLVANVIKTAIALTVASSIADMLLRITDDDGTYAALPDYIKTDYWIIPTGIKGKWVRIPRGNSLWINGFTLPSLSINDAVFGIAHGEDVGEATAGLAYDIGWGLLNAVTPIGEISKGNPIGSNANLNALIQWETNSKWTDDDIVPSYMEDLSPALQYTDTTSETAKLVGNITNTSPMKIDYVLNQNTGVLGEVKDSVEAGIKETNRSNVVLGGAAALKEFFLSRFLVDSAYVESVTDEFYDQRDRLNTLVSDVNETTERDGIPSSPLAKNLNPRQVKAMQEEAKTLNKRMTEVSKELSALMTESKRAANQGDEERARELRFIRQKKALAASESVAEFWDKWKKMGE